MSKMSKISGFLNKINISWKRQPALWALGLILLTAIVNRVADCAIPNRKDEVFIEMARRLTGQVDAETVSQIKEQVIAHLTIKLQNEYVTRTEMINADMTIADLVKTNVHALKGKIDAVAQLQDPDARYRQLLREFGNNSDGGRMPVVSDQAWIFMTRLYVILHDDMSFQAPHVAEAFLQIALRQRYQLDEKKRADLRHLIMFVMDYYEHCPLRNNQSWGVYKAITILLYDTSRFNGFVKEQARKNPSFEQQMRDSHFLNESFFTSDFWPLKTVDQELRALKK